MIKEAVYSDTILTVFSSIDTHLHTEDGEEIVACSITMKAKERVVTLSFPLGLDINPLDIHGKDVYVRFITEECLARHPILLKNLQYETFHMDIDINVTVIQKQLIYKADLILDLEHLPASERQKYER